MSDVKIRKAQKNDAPAIIKFNQQMARETENKTLDPEKIKSGVEAVFQDPAKGFYLIAERDNRPAGCLLITREWSDWRNAYFWWIQSVYVTRQNRRQGIYKALHKKVREMARSSDEKVVGFRLYVEKNNKIAQKTYKNIGMHSTYYKMFEELA
jgi:GNAT superfamily N-acetyltransferase